MSAFYFISTLLSLIAAIGYLAPHLVSLYRRYKNWRALRSALATAERIRQLEGYRDVLVSFKTIDKGTYLIFYAIGLLAAATTCFAAAMLVLMTDSTIETLAPDEVVAVGVFAIGALFAFVVIRYVTFTRTPGIDKEINRVEADLATLKRKTQ